METVFLHESIKWEEEEKEEIGVKVETGIM